VWAFPREQSCILLPVTIGRSLPLIWDLHEWPGRWGCDTIPGAAVPPLDTSVAGYFLGSAGYLDKEKKDSADQIYKGGDWRMSKCRCWRRKEEVLGVGIMSIQLQPLASRAIGMHKAVSRLVERYIDSDQSASTL
jgi:hypothetical protein